MNASHNGVALLYKFLKRQIMACIDILMQHHDLRLRTQHMEAKSDLCSVTAAIFVLFASTIVK